MQVKYFLERMNTSLHNDLSLQQKLKVVGIKTSAYTKANMISLLEKFYSYPRNIIDAWNRMNKFEKDLIEEYIRNNYRISQSQLENIMKVHDKKIKKTYYYSFSMFDVIEELSPIRIFFLPNEIPPFIKEIIEPLLSKADENLKPVAEVKCDEDEYKISVGETFEKDMVNLVKLVNSSKLKTTKDGVSLNKASILKVDSVLHNKDFVTPDFGSVENIRNLEQANKIFGIIEILRAVNVIEFEDGEVILGNNALKFLEMNTVEKCKYLLQGYINTSNFHEVARIKELKIIQTGNPRLKKGRDIILKLIAKCPINEWIDVTEFKNVIKINNLEFIAQELKQVEYFDSYGRYYTSRWQSWRAIEGRFIDIVLIEFLATLGIVDILISANMCSEIEYFSCDYFRLTPLGAHVLGKNKEYLCNIGALKSGFVVQPNFEVHVLNGGQKDVHDLFFDNYAAKLKDDMVSIYRLEFKALVKALDMGLDIQKLIDYLRGNAQNELPQNVITTLEMWKEKSKKINIRNVTIVETDDVFIMEELKSYKTIKNCVLKDLPFVFEIKSDEAMKVKREIEKKNHFCMLNNITVK